MKNNPFLSSSFTSVWLKYFHPGTKTHQFACLGDLKFMKVTMFPFYFNVGKNITNGMQYVWTNENENIRNKVFVIYDVPDYLHINSPSKDSKFKLKRINQYGGVYADLTKYKSFDEYFKNNFRSKRRNYIRKKKEALESEYGITHKYYSGNLSNEVYNTILGHLKRLILKRFQALKRDNSIISTWDYNFELMKSMLKDKRAIAISVNKDNIPIGITFNFLSDKTMFFAVTIFDIEFEKYNIGHINIMNTLNWCFENDIKILDFSKGISEYKNKWKNKEYCYQHHVLYDSGSKRAVLIASLVTGYFKIKQYLRDKHFNVMYSNLKYRINFLKASNS